MAHTDSAPAAPKTLVQVPLAALTVLATVVSAVPWLLVSAKADASLARMFWPDAAAEFLFLCGGGLNRDARAVATVTAVLYWPIAALLIGRASTRLIACSRSWHCCIPITG